MNQETNSDRDLLLRYILSSDSRLRNIVPPSDLSLVDVPALLNLMSTPQRIEAIPTLYKEPVSYPAKTSSTPLRARSASESTQGTPLPPPPPPPLVTPLRSSAPSPAPTPAPAPVSVTPASTAFIRPVPMAMNPRRHFYATLSNIQTFTEPSLASMSSVERFMLALDVTCLASRATANSASQAAGLQAGLHAVFAKVGDFPKGHLNRASSRASVIVPRLSSNFAAASFRALIQSAWLLALCAEPTLMPDSDDLSAFLGSVVGDSICTEHKTRRRSGPQLALSQLFADEMSEPWICSYQLVALAASSLCERLSFCSIDKTGLLQAWMMFNMGVAQLGKEAAQVACGTIASTQIELAPAFTRLLTTIVGLLHDIDSLDLGAGLADGLGSGDVRWVSAAAPRTALALAASMTGGLVRIPRPTATQTILWPEIDSRTDEFINNLLGNTFGDFRTILQYSIAISYTANGLAAIGVPIPREFAMLIQKPPEADSTLAATAPPAANRTLLEFFTRAAAIVRGIKRPATIGELALLGMVAETSSGIYAGLARAPERVFDDSGDAFEAFLQLQLVYILPRCHYMDTAAQNVLADQVREAGWVVSMGAATAGLLGTPEPTYSAEAAGKAVTGLSAVRSEMRRVIKAFLNPLQSVISTDEFTVLFINTIMERVRSHLATCMTAWSMEAADRYGDYAASGDSDPIAPPAILEKILQITSSLESLQHLAQTLAATPPLETAAFVAPLITAWLGSVERNLQSAARNAAAADRPPVPISGVTMAALVSMNIEEPVEETEERPAGMFRSYVATLDVSKSAAQAAQGATGRTTGFLVHDPTASANPMAVQAAQGSKMLIEPEVQSLFAILDLWIQKISGTFLRLFTPAAVVRIAGIAASAIGMFTEVYAAKQYSALGRDPTIIMFRLFQTINVHGPQKTQAHSLDSLVSRFDPDVDTANKRAFQSQAARRRFTAAANSDVPHHITSDAIERALSRACIVMNTVRLARIQLTQMRELLWSLASTACPAEAGSLSEMITMKLAPAASDLASAEMHIAQGIAGTFVASQTGPLFRSLWQPRPNAPESQLDGRPIEDVIIDAIAGCLKFMDNHAVAPIVPLLATTLLSATATRFDAVLLDSGPRQRAISQSDAPVLQHVIAELNELFNEGLSPEITRAALAGLMMTVQMHMLDTEALIPTRVDTGTLGALYRDRSWSPGARMPELERDIRVLNFRRYTDSRARDLMHKLKSQALNELFSPTRR